VGFCSKEARDIVEDKWQTLGFKRKPFIDLSRINPFLTPKQRQQLTLLEELVREGGHLLLLLGVAGVGKTTFLNALKKNIALPNTEETIGVCEMHGDQGVTIAMIKGLLAKHLALEDTADTFLLTLRARLAQLAQSNQRFLLIIDDAHELPAETVRFILDVVSELEETEHSLSILLAGRMQLEHLCVNSANVNMDWNTGSSFTIILQPLSEEEIINYIKHGLRQAGYRGVMPFSKTQLVELSHDSKGILARLVVMAVHILETKRRSAASSQTMLSRFSKTVRTVLKRVDKPASSAKRDVKRHFKIGKGHKGLIVAAVSVAMLSIGWWFYLEGPAPTAVDVSQGKVVSVEKEGPWVKTVVKLDGNVRRVDVTAPVTPVIHNTAIVPTGVNNTSIAPAVAMNKPITTPVANDAPVTPGVTNTIPIVKDVPIMTPIANDTPPSVVVKKNDPVAVTAQKKIAPTTSFKTQGYTIQIAGGTDLAAVQKTVCQLWTQQAKARCVGLPNTLRYIRTVKNGEDWYIATLGQYNSSVEAHTQLQQLPATVQKNTPWVRAFAQIPSLTVVASK
jgi:type II secretory pathway predicted ATPase ExeA/septal ring-binding cell division protein DamX